MNHKVKVVNGADVEIGSAIVDEMGTILSCYLEKELPKGVQMCESYSTKRDVVVLEEHP